MVLLTKIKGDYEMAKRNTIKYHLIQARKVVHRGVTNDLGRRQTEHQVEFPDSTIKQIGNRVTRESGLAWERGGGKRTKS